jgi:hypothetical protein
LGYFLSPLLGGFTFGAYTHKIKWEDVHSVKLDADSGLIQLSGIQDDGNTWLWTMSCPQGASLLEQVSHFVSVDGFKPSRATNGTALPELDASDVAIPPTPVTRDSITQGLDRCAFLVQKQRLKSEFVINHLAEELGIRPVEMVKELIPMLPDKLGERESSFDKAGIRQELEFYAELFENLGDPLLILDLEGSAQQRPILSWVRREEVVLALNGILKTSDKARTYLLKLDFGTLFELADKIEGTGKASTDVLRIMLDGLWQQQRAGAKVGLIVGICSLVLIAVLGVCKYLSVPEDLTWYGFAIILFLLATFLALGTGDYIDSWKQKRKMLDRFKQIGTQASQ